MVSVKKLLVLLCLCLAIPVATYATAFGSATAWDVRTTGADTNGGAFDSGGSSCGTDESQGAGTAITITTASSTTGTGSPAFTSTTHGPCNFVHIASGTGCTVGWYEILSQSSGTATFNVAIADTNGRSCVGVIGGSLLTVSQGLTNMVSSNTLWVKNGTFTITSSLSFQNISIMGLSGYTTTHGDLNGLKCQGGAACPTVTTATNSTPLILVAGGTITISNIIMTTTAATPDYGIKFVTRNTQALRVVGVVMSGFTTAVQADNSGCCFQAVSGIGVENSEIKSSTSDGFRSHNGLNSFSGSYIHGNSGSGVNDAGSSASFTFNNTTVYGNGTNTSHAGCNCNFVTASNSIFGGEVGGDGLLSTTVSLTNNIFFGNGRYGVNSANSLINRNNAYGSNTTANLNGIAAGLGDITGISNPWVSSATGNFALDPTNGAALKGAGFPGIGPAGTGYPDINALQTKSTSGGGNSASVQ